MSEKLAIKGGERSIPEGMVKPWPPVDEIDRRLVLQALESNKFTYGEQYAALEQEFAEWVGVPNTLFCNSGTAALHMALVACGCGCGDEVIVPAYTWPSSATCCLHHNIIPVFVDIDWDTMNIDIDQIEKAITPRTKAIVAVHLHGLPCDMDRIMDIGARHGLKVIEDACQAHGARYKGSQVGTFGDVAAFSCNQNKLMCSGEGGFFVSKDKEMFESGKKLWYFGEHGRPEKGAEHNAYGMGWMYRSTEMVAALARAQLSKLDRYIEELRTNVETMHQALEGTPYLIRPVEPEGFKPNGYNYTIRFDMDALGHAEDAAAYRNRICDALRAEGVSNGVWQGWPVPEMTAIAGRNAYGKGCPWRCSDSTVSYDLSQFPVALRHCNWHTGITMPLRSPNSTDVAERMAAGIRKVLSHTEQIA